MWNVGDAIRADPREIAGIAAVVAAHDQHQIERLLVEQRDDGVLALLRGAADRVEGAEVLRRAPPRRSDRAIAAPNISPISSDSDISIVV